jgi:hypothetical protein
VLLSVSPRRAVVRVSLPVTSSPEALRVSGRRRPSPSSSRDFLPASTRVGALLFFTLRSLISVPAGSILFPAPNQTEC